MSVFICQVCGHLEFNGVPENCPVCGSKKDAFKQDDDIFKRSAEESPEAEGKHVPLVKVEKKCDFIPEEGCTDVYARIGDTLHPSKTEHFIQFVDCYLDGEHVARAHFSPGVYPAACFHLKKDTGKLSVVENCNIHGYWMKEVEY